MACGVKDAWQWYRAGLAHGVTSEGNGARLLCFETGDDGTGELIVEESR